MNYQIHNQRNLLRKLTAKKLYNAWQVYSSYHLSKRNRTAKHKGMPISLAFEPTTVCNLRCPECPSGLRSFTRPTGTAQGELLRSLVDELHETLVYLTFYFQGEPYLNPQFLDMVKYASDKGIYTSTSTNAHYLNDKNAKATVESGLDRMIISIDGTTQETYEAYRKGGKLDKVIEGTQKMLEWRTKLKSKTPYIVFQFLVVKPNEHQIPDVQALGKKMGVDSVALKTAQIYDYENGSPLLPEQEQYSRYKKLDSGKYAIKNQLDHNCWRMWNSCVVTWDGAVVPCCFDKDAEHALGDLQKTSFYELWKSKPYNDFRQAVLKSRSEIEMCKNCTEGMSVWKD